KPVEQPDPIPNPSFSPQGDIRYYEGDIATHGLHITFVADSDNAQLTTPVDEIDSEQREVVLHGNAGNVGERYGHSSDKPLVTTAPTPPPPSRTTCPLMPAAVRGRETAPWVGSIQARSLHCRLDAAMR